MARPKVHLKLSAMIDNSLASYVACNSYVATAPSTAEISNVTCMHCLNKFKKELWKFSSGSNPSPLRTRINAIIVAVRNAPRR
jgi:hypothetical protein